jgi:hypothetical protein
MARDSSRRVRRVYSIGRRTPTAFRLLSRYIAAALWMVRSTVIKVLKRLTLERLRDVASTAHAAL